METNKLGQEPAFPVDGENQSDSLKYGLSGMSKRFYAACLAMQGLLSNSIFMSYITQEYSDNTDKEVVRNAYELADELLKQENL